MEVVMRDIRRGMWLMAIGITLLVAAQSFAEVNAGKTETDQKGCWCKYNSTSGQITPRPVIKTGDKEAPDEEGRAEIWVFIIEDVGKYQHEPDENGKIKPVNILAELFVPADGKAHDVQTGTTTRKYICKVWASVPTQNASK